MKHYLYFITISFLLLGCEKDEPVMPKGDKEELPPITMEGLNTFGCLINDSIWLPKNNGFNPTIHKLNAGHDEKAPVGERSAGIFATIYYSGQDTFRHETFRISFRNLRGVDIYNSENGLFKEANGQLTYDIWQGEPNVKYTVDTTQFHEVIITKLDEVNNIISGVFECTLQNTEDFSDKKKITEGRFDVVYFE